MPAPLGQPCQYCSIRVKGSDSGVVVPFLGEGGGASLEPWHLGCWLYTLGLGPAPYLVHFYREPVAVAHASLERAHGRPFRSKCPVCELGLLLVGRNQETLALRREDRCTRCAQAFRYTDREILGEGFGD